MSISLAKQYYLEQLKNGPVSHRLIMVRMSNRFEESPAAIKDALIKEGLIVCVKTARQGNGKLAYYHDLTGKKFVPEKTQVHSTSWEDGTAKSTGNAFDWRTKEQGIFTKQQIAQMQQKQVGNNKQVIVYSRA